MKHDAVVKDNYGHPFCIGSKVAFNHSGDVAIGFIQRIEPAKRYGKHVNEYTKEVYHNFYVRHQNSNKISVVRNRGSLVTI